MKILPFYRFTSHIHNSTGSRFRLLSTLNSSQRLAEVNRILASVKEPYFGKSLYELGLVKDVEVHVDIVVIKLDMKVPGHPSFDTIVKDCEDKLSELNWVKEFFVSDSMSGISDDINEYIKSQHLQSKSSSLMDRVFNWSASSSSSESKTPMDISSLSASPSSSSPLNVQIHHHKQSSSSTSSNRSDPNSYNNTATTTTNASTMNNTQVASTSTSTISGIKNIIGVSSCKGGVGKSTVAVNFAFALAKKGLRVGLLDADIYGPSLPYMVTPLSDIVRKSRTNPKNILPLETAEYGIKMLSFGHVNPKAGVQGAGGREAAVLRGPVASKVITQMIVSTEWGDLDYMVVDMPPGTGDIQITLSQTLPFTGAIIVTTPHHLSLVDAAKGVAMFQYLKIPTLALVENMSYFICNHGEKYYPFGYGGRENLLKGLQMSILSQSQSQIISSSSSSPSTSTTATSTSVSSSTSSSGGCASTLTESKKSSGTSNAVNDALDRLKICPLYAFPLSPSMSSTTHISNTTTTTATHHNNNITTRNDISQTSPHTHGYNTPNQGQIDEVNHIYSSLVNDVILEIFKQKVSTQMLPTISYMESQGMIVFREYKDDSVIEYKVPSTQLRIRDTVTGEIIKDNNKNDLSKYKDIKPIKFDLKGNYGVAINWSDGYYADIFPYETIKKISKLLKEIHEQQK